MISLFGPDPGYFPAGNCMFKVNNRKIVLKVNNKDTRVFIVSSEHISRLVLVFLLST